MMQTVEFVVVLDMAHSCCEAGSPRLMQELGNKISPKVTSLFQSALGANSLALLISAVIQTVAADTIPCHLRHPSPFISTTLSSKRDNPCGAWQA